MKILFLGINFAPELTGVGKYSGEMIEWLSSRGHEVQVATAPPYYPEWRIGAGYRGWRYKKECMWRNAEGSEGHDPEGAVTVYRCPVWVPAKPNTTKRLVHLASFVVSSLPLVLWLARWRPDLVFAVAPTIMTAPWAILAARWSGAAVWLHIQDFEIDIAFDMAMLRKSLTRRSVAAVERSIYRAFDRVSTISDRMLERLVEKGVEPERTFHFSNWVDTDTIRPLNSPSGYRSELGVSERTVVAMYSGNLGEKQGLEVLIEAAAQTGGEEDLVWVISGTGGAEKRLRRLASGQTNVRWLPLQPAKRLNDFLNMADIHLLPQRPEAADLVLPSKLAGMLASGKAVVATAQAQTQLGRIVGECGVIVPPGDANALAGAVVSLARDPRKRKELGIKARRFAVTHLDKKEILGQFEREAIALVEENTATRQGCK